MPIIRSSYSQLYQLDTDTQTKLALLDKLSDMSYDEFSTEYTQFIRVSDSEAEGETDFAVGGFGLPIFVDGELGGLNYDTQGRWFQQTYVFGTYNLGFVVSHDMQADDKWGLGGQRARWLGRSFRRLPEVLVARMFNEGFAAVSKTGIMNAGRRSPDGRPLFDTAHPNPGPGGGTQSNTNASGGASLTHASVEAMMIRMASRTDDRGTPIQIDMKTLLVPKALYPRALEITNSSFRTDASVATTMNVLPNVMAYKPLQSHYLSSTTAYFGLAEPSQTGLRWIWRERPNRNSWVDPATRAIHYGVWTRFDFGWSHYWGVDGDPG